jgi:bacterioferritin
MLSSDLELEHQAHATLKEAVALCETAGDFVSRELVQEILCSEEEHIDWIETQLGLIDSIGLENYLQSHC